MYVSLSKLPAPKNQYQIFMRDFRGGLNLSRVSTEIADNQSPSMCNLLWDNGVLKRRPGQRAVPVENSEAFQYQFDTLIAVHERVIGNKILFAYRDIEGSNAIAYCSLGNPITSEATITTISRDARGRAGCFFEYGGHIYFKGIGCYKKISLNEDGSFTAEDVVPYVPVIQINTNPETGVGDLYQPENRLSAQKEVWYNADSGVRTVEFTCDGEATTFRLPHIGGASHGSLLSVIRVYVGASLLDPTTDFSVNAEEGVVILNEVPPASLKVTVTYATLMSEYTLPDPLANVDEVWVKNLATGEYEQYTDRSGIYDESQPDPGKRDFVVDATKSVDNAWKLKVRFCDPDGITKYNGAYINDANVLNSFVKVRYSSENVDAYRAIDECHIVSTYGNGGLESNCIVMAGATAQPNAFFWNGNDSAGGNPGYFPVMNYNLAGEFFDPITAFGKQQNKLVIFQRNRIGSATFAIDEVDGRMVVSLPYRTVNDRIGCDLPKSVQLVENNLVWAHTQHGVMYLKDSTYAYETLVACISGNINNTLLLNITEQNTSSMDDGNRYWLFSGSNAYVWDYSLQGYTANTEKLSWFPMNGIVDSACNAVIFGDAWFRVSSRGEIVFFSNYDYKDFDENFYAFFRTKDFHFGTYAYRKNVEKLILSFPRTDNIRMQLSYETDLEIPRNDRMDICTISDEASDVGSFVKVRTPKCKHIHTFACSVNSIGDNPFELIAMQIFYTFMGSKTIKAGQRM